ncbi:MAG: PspC domain-containing protein [Candidatus Paceibacterota bacterium]|jgi:phage shock protein PspC (stress-responsive transcriptional regulator)
MKKLYRSNSERIIWGVCGGLGNYFQIDPILIRILFVLLFFAGGTGLFVYIILAIMIPKSPEEEKKEEIMKVNKGFRSFLGLLIALVGLNIILASVFSINIFYLLNWKIFLAILLILVGIKIISENEK